MQWGLSAPELHQPLWARQHGFKLPLQPPGEFRPLHALCATVSCCDIRKGHITAALNPHNTPTTPLCPLIPRCTTLPASHVARWPCLHLYSSPRLPPELDLLLLHGIFAVGCNRTFISGFSLVQSKLILLADFSTVSGGSYGTLSMLLALMMHNTNPSLEQECALMMD